MTPLTPWVVVTLFLVALWAMFGPEKYRRFGYQPVPPEPSGRRHMNVNLGDKAKDKVTGFVGIVTGHAQHISGCDTYGLTPPVNDKGEAPKSEWFDANRIEVVEARAVVVEPVIEAAPLRRVGGPQDTPKATR